MNEAIQILETATGTAFPGCQAWVSCRGEVVLDVSMGRRSTDEDAEAVDSATLFDIASVTKAIGTSVVLMRLYDLGALDLNRRVVRDLGRLPWAPFLVDATYLDLLNHRSGLLGYKELFLKFRPEDLPLPGQARRALAARIAALPQSYPAGEKNEYSDFGFMLLGWALEYLCGVPLSALFQTHLGATLDLRSLTTSDSDGPALENVAAAEKCPWRKGVVQGHVHDEHAFLLGGCAGHAGLFANARDVGRVGKVLLDAFHGRDNSFLSQHTVRRFWNPSNALNGEGHRLGFDSAAAEQSQAGTPATPWTVGHLGFTGTSLWIYPEVETVAVLNTNRVNPDRRNMEIQDLRRNFHTAIMKAVRNPESEPDSAPNEQPGLF